MGCNGCDCQGLRDWVIKDTLVFHCDPHDPIDRRARHLIKGQSLGHLHIWILTMNPRRVSLCKHCHSHKLDDPVTIGSEIPSGEHCFTMDGGIMAAAKYPTSMYVTQERSAERLRPMIIGGSTLLAIRPNILWLLVENYKMSKPRTKERRG